MAESAQFDAVLQLGKKIVDELGLDESTDTLGRWIAHYIAELIHGAETATAEDRTEKSAHCASEILEIWKHRNVLPYGKRPFEEVEPILRALASLDPDDDTPRYFRPVRPAAAPHEEDNEVKQLLAHANAMDYSAKILIRHLLMLAGQKALNKSSEWGALAETLDQDDDIDLFIMRHIKAENELLNFKKLAEANRKEVEDRLTRLDEFIAMATELSADWHSRLAQAEVAALGDRNMPA